MRVEEMQLLQTQETPTLLKGWWGQTRRTLPGAKWVTGDRWHPQSRPNTQWSCTGNGTIDTYIRHLDCLNVFSTALSVCTTQQKTQSYSKR